MSRPTLFDDDVEDEPNPADAILLQQRAETVADNVLLYNVFYNNDETFDNPLISPVAGMKKDFGTVEEDPALRNLVRIDIDVNELKNYTAFSPKSSKDLKQLANELTKSIQIDENGDVRINSVKLNPNAVHLVHRNLNLTKFEDRKFNEKNNDQKKVLFKTTKVYGDRKYLLIISYIERSSNVNKIILAHEGTDQVYEEFELFMELTGICLTNPSKKPLNWEVSIQECQKICGSTDISKIAKFFAHNVNIFSDQFILSTPLKVNTRYNGVIILNENLIRTLQNKYRLRKFIKNFSMCKETIKQLGSKIIAQAVVNTNNEPYKVIAYEKGNSLLVVQAWHLQTYQQYELVLDEKPLEKYVAIDKERTIKKIFMYITFEFNKYKQYTLVLREKQFLDSLTKEFYS
mgnify:CR=1 FL=1